VLFYDIVLYLFLSQFLSRFRWVFCQLETLRHCLPPSVRGILAELPETLDETYERILREIPKTNQVHAHRLLQCLTVAVRPLKVEELAEVLAINFDAEEGIPKLNEGFRWSDQEQAVLSACSSLVVIVEDGASRRVQFSHFSVKEFLTSDRLAASAVDALRGHHICFEPAHTIIAKACLGVLLRLNDDMDKETIKSYPLADYAGKCFVVHAGFGDVLSHVNNGLGDLLDPDKPHFYTWLWLQYGDWGTRIFAWGSEFESISKPSTCKLPVPVHPPRIFPLYYALALRHSCLARHLILKRPRDLYASDKYGTTALHIAAYLLNCNVAQMLVERTSAIDVRDNSGRTPLHYAMRDDTWDHDERELSDVFHCVRLLLDSGASAEAQNNVGSTPLHAAAASRTSQEIVQLLIENSTNIDLRNNIGQTALHEASQCGQPDILRLILNHNADVNAPDNHGWTPLLLAIRKARSEAVQLLLKHGASVTLRNDEGRTALHEASQGLQPDLIQLILNHNADVDALDSDGSTPLHLTIFEESLASSEISLVTSGMIAVQETRLDASLDAIQLLLRHGANINLQNHMGQTALHKASQCGHLDIVRHILSHGAHVDSLDNDGSTPLHLAISEVNLEVVQLLLKHGASVNLQNHLGQTALHKASQRYHLDIVRLILDHGAGLNLQDNHGSTPLHLAAHHSSQQVVQLFLEHGADVTLRNDKGQSTLHQASQRGHIDIIQLLLNYDADVDAIDNDGSTALHLAISEWSLASSLLSSMAIAEAGLEARLETVQLLLRDGANTNLQNHLGQTALHKASHCGHLGIIELILDHNSDVDARDYDGSTPLHLAISEASLEAVELLLKHGASVHTQNNRGETLFQAASARGIQEITELLSMHIRREQMA
jgi:ankyrin repeat protein